MYIVKMTTTSQCYCWEEACNAHELENRRSVIDGKVQLVNVKDAVPVLKEWASTEKLQLYSAVEDANSLHTELRAVSAIF